MNQTLKVLLVLPVLIFSATWAFAEPVTLEQTLPPGIFLGADIGYDYISPEDSLPSDDIGAFITGGPAIGARFGWQLASKPGGLLFRAGLGYLGQYGDLRQDDGATFFHRVTLPDMDLLYRMDRSSLGARIFLGVTTGMIGEVSGQQRINSNAGDAYSNYQAGVGFVYEYRTNKYFSLGFDAVVHLDGSLLSKEDPTPVTGEPDEDKSDINLGGFLGFRINYLLPLLSRR